MKSKRRNKEEEENKELEEHEEQKQEQEQDGTREKNKISSSWSYLVVVKRTELFDEGGWLSKSLARKASWCPSSAKKVEFLNEFKDY